MLDDPRKQPVNRTRYDISPEIIVRSHSYTEESRRRVTVLLHLNKSARGLVVGNVTVATVCEDELLTTISQELEKKKEDLKQNPTAALGDDTHTENLHQS